MATYTLNICGSNDKKAFLCLTYDKNNTSSPKLMLGGVSLTCKLLGIHFAKAIYQPGCVRFKLQLTSQTTRPKIADVFARFKDAYIDLTSKENGQSQSVAEKYHLFDIQPAIKSSADKEIELTLTAYSPDKYLTIDKYCKAYTGKKFLNDIVCETTNWPTQLPSEISSNSEIDTKLIATAPQHISADKTTNKEYIQPYLVQYNESFFDFLVRVMSRCGEFFFFENSKFHFGWAPSDSIAIDSYTAMRFSQSIPTAWKDDTIGYTHDNYNYLDVSNGENYKDRPRNSNSSSLNADSEIASDENLTPIPPKDKYTSMEEFALMPGAFSVSAVSGMLSEKTMTDMLSSLALTQGAVTTSSLYSSSTANDGYEESFFKAKEGQNAADYEERMDGEKIHLYSSTVSSGTEPFSMDFYANIERKMKEVEQGRVRIDLGEAFYATLSLGAEVSFEGTPYIVVRMEGEITPDTESVRIEVLPKSSDSAYYPPLAPIGPIRTASAQRAFVAANNDPMRMNRVRIRFPWQKESDDPSPWIRIALPMASDSSGFNFIPEKGDEAIVNFENGNIEKPYVEGLLYSADRKPSYTYKKNNMRSISSRNGHSIIFYDNDKGTDAIQSLSPLWSTINSFVPVLRWEGTEDMQKATGGIEFTDEYGLYSISMSSNKRTISIDSPLGSVSINAFTGITISAPNGNVRIEGKNIDIVAGNNLSISSGNNIIKEYWPLKAKNNILVGTKRISEVGEDLLSSVVSALSPIDMKLIRTIMETFLRPIGGTMLIKSNRYLRLEAGKGSANILGREFVKQRWVSSDSVSGAFTHDRAKKNFQNVFTEEITQNIDIDSLKAEIDRYFNEHKNHHQTIDQIKNNYDWEKQAIDSTGLFETTTTSDDIITQQKKPEFKLYDLAKRIFARARLEDLAKHIKEIGSTLSKEVENATKDKVWQNFLNTCPKNLKKVFGDNEIKSLMGNIIDPVYFLNGNTYRAYNQGLTPDVAIKREIIHKALVILVKEHNSKNPFPVTLPGADGLDYADDQDWRDWIDGISMAVQTEPQSISTTGSKVKDFFMEAWDIENWMDQYAWDSTDDGKILISEREDETLRIDDQGILVRHTYQVPANELNTLKDNLKAN